MSTKEPSFIGFNDIISEETEFIPLLSADDEKEMDQEEFPDLLPILPLRNNVLFPGVVIPITVGRDKSIKLVKDAYNGNKTIGVIAQKNQEIEDPQFEDLQKVGTIARIIKMLRMPDGNTTIIIQGKRRFTIDSIVKTEPYLKASIKTFVDTKPTKGFKKFEALISSIRDLAMRIIKASPQIPTEASIAIQNIESPSFLISFISSNLNVDVLEKQAILEVEDLEKRANLVLEALTKELQMLELKNDIQSKVRVDIDKQQREYFLHQQIKTIQEELGGNPIEQEIEELRDKGKNKVWSKEIGQHFEKELEKLKRMNPAGAEYSVQLNYVETLVELPWNEYSKDKFDLVRADKILNRDHFGLRDVKNRILEHLAVLKLKGDMKAPILCFVGPPGVGKTSLGKSIAEALNRKYIRMSLGGLHDESEIRGHRKTYIGAMPGRIIQQLKKAKTSNPVFILDELDKLGRGTHGDPSSAMLEVLDPEQNGTFYDNFLEVEFDLSKVLFIATANSLATIQPALLDRLEIIDVSGYTIEEKVHIAKKHLIPKQLKEHGLKATDLRLNPKIIEKVVEEYTRESGVRRLEKQIAKLVRYAAKNIAMETEFDAKLTPNLVEDILGVPRPKDKYENNSVAGVVTGLAWTQVGGDILYIESVLTKGKGRLSITGNLGDVMKESATLALEYLKVHHEEFNIPIERFEQYNVHIHVPEGATPKDGPSAGITMLTALASVFTQRKVRAKLAMTGEITLRGTVLPVGGIKEKILAAKRANITDVILCSDNQKDVNEITADYLTGLNFHYVKNMREVLQLALLPELVDQPIKF